MFIKNWKKEICTIPNLLSLCRLAMIPVYVRIYLKASRIQDYYLAGGILALSCLTDLIDGRIARKYNMISNTGKILDPLADKSTQFALILCLSMKHPVLRSLLILFIIKESFQFTTMFLAFHNDKELPNALLPGKICTTVLFISLTALVIFPNLSSAAVKAITLGDALFLLFSFVSYIFTVLEKGRNTQDI